MRYSYEFKRKAIMERVGHNEPRTTLAIYTHVTDEMKQEVNAAITNMGKVLANKSGGCNKTAPLY